MAKKKGSKKKVEKNIWFLEGKWHLLIKNAPNLIFVHDRKGVIQFINCSLIKTPVEKVIGTNMYDYIDPKHHKLVKKIDEKVWKTKKPERYVIQGEGPHKELSWYETLVGPIIKKGKVIALSAFTIDITEKKKAEEALKGSEEKYKTLFESSRDAIMILAPPTWKFTAGNLSTIKMFNAKNEKDFTSKGPWKVSPKYQSDGQLSSKKAKKMIDKAMKQGSNFFEWQHKRINGDEFPATVLLTKIKLGEKELLQATVRDITEKKKAEEALKESEEKFKQFFENAPEYCYIISPKGMILNVNETALKALGYTKSELIGKPLKTIYAPESLSKMKEIFLEWKKTGKLENEEIVIQTKKGKKRTVLLSVNAIKNKDGKILHSISIQKDITERKKAEEELSQQREEQQIILDSIPAMIFYKDKKDRIERANKALADAFHMPIDEIIGKTAAELNPGKNQWEVDKRVMKTGQPLRNMIESLKTPEGTKWFQIDKIPYKNADGNIIGIIGFSIDITKQKKAEEALKENEARLNSIIQSIPEGMDIVDENFNILWMTEKFLKIFGKSSIGKKCYELYKDNKKQCSDCPIKKPVKIGESRFLIVEGVVGGKIFEINHAGIMYEGKKAILEVFRDITEQKKAKETLKESEEKYRKIFNYSNDAIFLIDITQDKIIDANKKASEMLGYSREELLSLPMSAVHPDEMPKLRAFAQSVYKQGSGWTNELTCLTKKGKKLDSEISASTIKFNRATYMIAQVRDISDRKKADQILKKRTEELEKFNEFAVGRELKMVELKKEINELYKKLGKKSGYKIKKVKNENSYFIN